MNQNQRWLYQKDGGFLTSVTKMNLSDHCIHYCIGIDEIGNQIVRQIQKDAQEYIMESDHIETMTYQDYDNDDISKWDRLIDLPHEMEEQSIQNVQFHLFSSICHNKSSKAFTNVAQYLKRSFEKSKVYGYLLLTNHMNQEKNAYESIYKLDDRMTQEEILDACFLLEKNMDIQEISRTFLNIRCHHQYEDMMQQYQGRYQNQYDIKQSYILLNGKSEMLEGKILQTYLVSHLLEQFHKRHQKEMKDDAMYIYQKALCLSTNISIEDLYYALEDMITYDKRNILDYFKKEYQDTFYTRLLQGLYDICFQVEKGYLYLNQLLYGVDEHSIFGIIKQLEIECKEQKRRALFQKELMEPLLKDDDPYLQEQYETACYHEGNADFMNRFIIQFEYHLRNDVRELFSYMIREYKELCLIAQYNNKDLINVPYQEQLDQHLQEMNIEAAYEGLCAVLKNGSQYDISIQHVCISEDIEHYFDVLFQPIIQQIYDDFSGKNIAYSQLDQQSDILLKELLQLYHETKGSWKINPIINILCDKTSVSILQIPATHAYRIGSEKMTLQEPMKVIEGRWKGWIQMYFDVPLLLLDDIKMIEYDYFQQKRDYYLPPLSSYLLWLLQKQPLKIKEMIKEVEQLLERAIQNNHILLSNSIYDDEEMDYNKWMNLLLKNNGEKTKIKEMIDASIFEKKVIQ